MAHDDQFTATGPSLVGSGFPRSAFSSSAAGMVYGVNVQGDRAGVYGESVRAETGRESDIEGVGVAGVGDNVGVFARTFPSPDRPGLAGLLAQHNRGGVGALGATMRGGTGVVGTSVGSLGNPLDTFADGHGPGDGSGTGVLGSSGSGSGVRGTSLTADGVRGESGSGDAVAGRSASGRGGRFESGRTEDGSIVGQISLVPHPMPTTRRVSAVPTIYDREIVERLPAEGRGGDLLVTQADDGTCTLWFCSRSSADGERATWREVLLGDPAAADTTELAQVDWTAIGDDRAIGTLHGGTVTLTGPLGSGSSADALFRGFDSELFSPRLTASDCLEIVGGTGHRFTVSFGRPVKDPVLHLASLGSVLTFDENPVLTKVSGDSGFAVSGSTVTGAVVLPSADSNGTVQITGVFTTLSFGLEFAGTDGVFLQISGLPG